RITLAVKFGSPFEVRRFTFGINPVGNDLQSTFDGCNGIHQAFRRKSRAVTGSCRIELPCAEHVRGSRRLREPRGAKSNANSRKESLFHKVSFVCREAEK